MFICVCILPVRGAGRGIQAMADAGDGAADLSEAEDIKDNKYIYIYI